jgi:hypothetical protein
MTTHMMRGNLALSMGSAGTPYKKEARRMSHMLEISPAHVTLDKFIDSIQKKLELNDKLWKDRVVLHNEFLFWQSIREAKF